MCGGYFLGIVILYMRYISLLTLSIPLWPQCTHPLKVAFQPDFKKAQITSTWFLEDDDEFIALK